jgi:hypothetical protein
MMYDGLTGRFTFGCPTTGEARVPLSRFRRLERLAGPAHPAVFRVTFACSCGDEHDGLVRHDELDWAPLGTDASEFFNLMTRRLEPTGRELVEQAARRIGGGAWPWSFFCYPEGRTRPVFPSAFRALAPAERRVGVAVRCPDCSGTTVNVVTTRHVDEPFYSDARVHVIAHVFDADRDELVRAFREELDSAAFDTRRLEL